MKQNTADPKSRARYTKKYWPDWVPDDDWVPDSDEYLTTTEHRKRLRRAGYLPIPINSKHGKRPAIEEWEQKIATTDADIEEWAELKNAKGTGLLTRVMPTLDIDILNKAAAEAVEQLIRERFEDRGRILTRVGRAPKRAIPFHTDTPFSKITIGLVAADGDTSQQLEFMADGEQIVGFGIHPDTGKAYEWFGGEPGDIKLAALPLINEAEAQQLIDDAAELLCDKFGYSIKSRKQSGDAQNSEDWEPLLENIRDGSQLHDSIRDLAAKFIKSGMSGGAAVNLLRGLMNSSTARRDVRFMERFADIPRTVAGAEEFIEEIEQKEQAEVAGKRLFDPWARFIVPPFPIDVLPPNVQQFVGAESEWIGVDEASMAMCMLATFSGALDHRFSLKMMRHGSWCVSPRLWTLLFGDPSTKKTPAINAALGPLEYWQAETQRTYRRLLAEYAAAKDAGDEAAKKPEPFARFVTYDCTIEKLGELLARSPRGMLVKRDELSGWLGSMERYAGKGGSANRGFWLQAYDGGPFTVDRIGRGEIFIDNLSVSLIAGIQPEKLAEMRGLTSDGLLQRFIPIVMAPARRPIDEENVINDIPYHALVISLLEAKPEMLKLSDPALQAMNTLQNYLHELMISSAGLARGFQGFLGKLLGMAGTFTLLLHMAADPSKGGGKQVSRQTVEAVHRLVVEFIIPHALEFYRSIEGSTNSDRLRRLASWILTSGKARFVASDLAANVADFRGSSLFETNERVSPLVAAGWLKPEGGKGPTCNAWKVAPEVFTQFAEQAKEEEARKAMIANLMNSPRRG